MRFDQTYFIFVIPAMIISLIAQIGVKNAYSRYSRVDSKTGLTGKDVAEIILQRNGINNVRITRGRGMLTDHFNPVNNTVALSEGVYNSTSVAALAIAAHEIGHVIQHDTGYTPIKVRSSLIPVANIGAQFSWIIFLIGLWIDSLNLMNLGIFLFLGAFMFQLVTLPVEFNASRRGVLQLSDGIMTQEQMPGAKAVLKAAAMTYVAAMLASLLQLFRLIALRDRKRD